MSDSASYTRGRYLTGRGGCLAGGRGLGGETLHGRHTPMRLAKYPTTLSHHGHICETKGVGNDAA